MDALALTSKVANEIDLLLLIFLMLRPAHMALSLDIGSLTISISLLLLEVQNKLSKDFFKTDAGRDRENSNLTLYGFLVHSDGLGLFFKPTVFSCRRNGLDIWNLLGILQNP